MLESFKNLKAGNVANVQDSMLFPLLRWSSASKIDLPWCAYVNKYFFYLPKEIQKMFLAVGLHDKNMYIKYPKLQIAEEKTFELKKQLLMKFYGWSEQEFQSNVVCIGYVDWLEVLTSLGCEPSDYKKLGIKFEKKPKQVVITEKKPAKKTLFDFG